MLRTVLSIWCVVLLQAVYGCQEGQTIQTYYNNEWTLADIQEIRTDGSNMVRVRYHNFPSLCLDAHTEYFGATGADQQCWRSLSQLRPEGQTKNCQELADGFQADAKEEDFAEANKTTLIIILVVFCGVIIVTIFNACMYKYCYSGPGGEHSETSSAPQSPLGRFTPKGMRNMNMFSPMGGRKKGLNIDTGDAYGPKPKKQRESAGGKWGNRLDMSFSWTLKSPVGRFGRKNKVAPVIGDQSLWDQAQEETRRKEGKHREAPQTTGKGVSSMWAMRRVKEEEISVGEVISGPGVTDEGYPKNPVVAAPVVVVLDGWENTEGKSPTVVVDMKRLSKKFAEPQLVKQPSLEALEDQLKAQARDSWRGKVTNFPENGAPLEPGNFATVANNNTGAVLAKAVITPRTQRYAGPGQGVSTTPRDTTPRNSNATPRGRPHGPTTKHSLQRQASNTGEHARNLKRAEESFPGKWNLPAANSDASNRRSGTTPRNYAHHTTPRGGSISKNVSLDHATSSRRSQSNTTPRRDGSVTPKRNVTPRR